MLLAAVALFLAPVAEDAVLTEPAFDKPITVEAKRSLVEPLVRQIAEATSTVLGVGPSALDLKVSVFAKERPAREVLLEIANVLDCKYVKQTNGYILLEPPLKVRTEYMWLEDDLQFADALNRLRQLSDAVKAAPYEGSGKIRLPELPFHEGSPKEWAQKARKEACYYVLGLWTRTPRRATFYCSTPQFFRVEEPRTAFERRYGLCSIDRGSAGLQGAFVAIRYLQESAEFQVVPVATVAKDRTPVSPLPYQYASPPDELAGNAFAQRVRQWPQEIPKEFADVQIEDAVEPVSEFSNGKIGLADLLSEIHRCTGRTIVADDYRIPILSPPALAGSLTSVLERLRKLGFFVRADKDTIRLRHPAFWRLRNSEPDEARTLALEAKSKSGSLSLADYARYVYVGRARGLNGVLANIPGHLNRISAWPLYWRDVALFERFLTPDRVLVRFNVAPICDGYPVLCALGPLQTDALAALIGGPTFDKFFVKQWADRSLPVPGVRGGGPLGPTEIGGEAVFYPHDGPQELLDLWGAYVPDFFQDPTETAAHFRALGKDDPVGG